MQISVVGSDKVVRGAPRDATIGASAPRTRSNKVDQTVHVVLIPKPLQLQSQHNEWGQTESEANAQEWPDSTDGL